MDYTQWKETSFSELSQYEALAAELEADLAAQLEGRPAKILRLLPNNWQFAAVLVNDDATKWMHLTVKDVREGSGWFDEIKLRRMSSERDWKGDEFHFAAWDEIGAAIEKYMGDEYDDEVL